MQGHQEAAPQELLALMPFAALVGIRAERAGRQEVVTRLPWAKERCTAAGVLHGGALVTLADCAAGICAYLNLPAGATTSTIELKTHYFAAVRGGDVVAVARPLHLGGSFAVIQTDLFNETGTGVRRRVGQTTQTQAVLRGH
ncbi:aromatic compound degradation protein PaaI [Streptomyces silvensis]|uniref:Aromatic compound degradation protein PaaI n=3 Tax=Streptomyces TaxID=1883 RepID=A0A0W7X9S2_9ACTN|nr:aromatic compound degradation protein PaaI [Streptomyces silvensis]MVO88420.1 hotdog fold thioesterase [Streptomyces typhae]